MIWSFDAKRGTKLDSDHLQENVERRTMWLPHRAAF